MSRKLAGAAIAVFGAVGLAVCVYREPVRTLFCIVAVVVLAATTLID